MEIRTIAWVNNKIRIIDQTKLPQGIKYLDIKDLKTLWIAIKELKVRGAPVLGAAAALGSFVGIRYSRAASFNRFMQELEKVAKYIGSSRPTARNLFWGLERVKKIALDNKGKPIRIIKSMILKEAQAIIQDDRVSCRKIGSYGARLVKDADVILTICNAGILATIDYGTALGVIYRAHQQRKNIKVYACETRPLLQGARLTTWELQKRGLDVTLICDSMAATLMRSGKIDKVITGADRIAANGDSANKIGTYNLAVLSRYHKIPFYVAAPASSFDLSIKSGQGITIEERDPREITELFFKKPIAVSGVKVFNPAFDVTDQGLISAFITDKGIIKPPYKKNIQKTFSK
ncbi:MAG: S-methyl-5-thioribose-1-phosphate isomerase [Candidatus Omnitrophica bacterium]|nr:S-methyl-5-thioribose-1-phosphate isomerase [Candidatus Omnitrophota bacterium]